MDDTGDTATMEKNLKKYKNALRIAYEDGVIIPEEKDFLELKKKKLNINDKQHIRLEIEVLLELGRQAIDQGRLGEAIDFVKKTIESGDTGQEIQEQYTCLLVLNGDYEGAKDSLDKCKELAAKDAAPAAVGDGPACPDCGGAIRHIAQYDRWYCDVCKKYLAKDFKPGEAKAEEPKPEPKPEPEPAPQAAAEPTCPDCSGKIRHIAQYGRFYCDACKKYMPKDFKPEEAKAEESKPETKPEPEPEPAPQAAAEPTCPDCSGKIRHIAQYGRFYCDACKKYMAKDFKPEEAKAEEPKPEPKPEPEPEPAPQAAAEPTCPDCNGKIRHIAQYGRFYCDACKKYMAKDFKAGEPKAAEPKPEPKPEPQPEPAPQAAAESTCPDCNGKIRHIAQYDRYYCDACKKYMAKDYKPGGAPAAEPQPETPKEPSCPDCSGKIRHIAQYDRWYCDACKKYMATGFTA